MNSSIAYTLNELSSTNYIHDEFAPHEFYYYLLINYHASLIMHLLLHRIIYNSAIRSAHIIAKIKTYLIKKKKVSTFY